MVPLFCKRFICFIQEGRKINEKKIYINKKKPLTSKGNLFGQKCGLMQIIDVV